MSILSIPVFVLVIRNSRAVLLAPIAQSMMVGGSNDCDGHGTHVAGTVGSRTYGVAKQARLYAVRVLDCRGNGTLSGVIAGVDWVSSNYRTPAVANMSLGAGSSRSLNSAVQNSINRGVSYVVAAGNESTDACFSSPAQVADAITVAASTRSDVRASYSNYGTCVDVFAPGSGITSTWNSSDSAISSISGTSMASPHVAGIAALYLMDNPSSTPSQVAAAISDNASAGRLSNIGSGSPNLLAYSLLTPDDGGGTQPPAGCPTGYTSHSGSLAGTNDYEYQPNGTYYYAAISGGHNAILTGPQGTDFDLYLWKWSSFSGWQTVAESTSADSDEAVQHSGSSGYYVWRVESYSGSGSYEICLQQP